MSTFSISVNEGEAIEVTEQEYSALDLIDLGATELHLLENNKSVKISILNICLETKTVDLEIHGTRYSTKINSELDRLINEMGLTLETNAKVDTVNAPMPGMVLNVIIKVGDTVEKGDSLLILEAMKMENVIKAPGEGVVAEVLVKSGAAVDKGAVLIRFED